VRRDFDPDIAGSSGPVVDNNLLTQLLTEFWRHDAANDVRRAAWRKGNDHADRSGRIRVSREGIRCDDRSQAMRQDQRTSKHIYHPASGELRHR